MIFQPKPIHPKARRCRLQHAKTGRIIDAPSIIAFAHAARLSGVTGGWQMRVGAVLNGKAPHFRGWFNPAIRDREAIKTHLKVSSKWNNVAKGSVRRCHLMHLHTGRVINVRSITAFRRKARLRGSDHLHITPVLDGQRLQHKGWVLPERVNRKVALTDVYGNQYRPVKVLDLIKQHGFKARGLKRILSGGLFQTRRLALSDSPIKGVLSPRATKVTEYVFRQRDASQPGRPRVYRGAVLKDIAAQMGVESSRLYPLLYGWSPRIRMSEHVTIEAVAARVEPKVAEPSLPLAAQ
jgi:hypothetical protein